MPTDVILPRVDMDMATGKVSRWFVTENSAVEKGQVIFEIETDKAAMEIDAPASGIIRDIVGEEGREMPVGSLLARIYKEGEAYEGPVRAAPGAPIDIPTAADAPDEPAAPAPATPPARSLVAAQDEDRQAEPAEGLRATPLARRLARENRIDLGRVRGSGPRGRIQCSDVLDHLSTAPQPASEAYPGAVRSCRPKTGGERLAAPGAGPLHRVWLRQGTGTPIVLVHGFGADLNGWRPALSAFPNGRPVLGLDLPGHGRSPLNGAATLDDLADAVLETLHGEGVESLHLIGHSLGAAVSATVAARSRLDILSTMLIAPAGLGPDMNGAFIDGFLRATSEASLMPWARELVFDESALGPTFVRATLRDRTGDRIAEQERLAASLFPEGTQAFSIRPLLESFDWPVKVVFGTEDKIIPARHAAGLPGTVAVHLFPATGHMPQIEQRHAVGRLVGELVRLR